VHFRENENNKLNNSRTPEARLVFSCDYDHCKEKGELTLSFSRKLRDLLVSFENDKVIFDIFFRKKTCYYYKETKLIC